MKVKFSGTCRKMSIAWMKPITGPLLPRMICHEMVRIRKLVKNGAITRNRIRFLNRPPRKAMK